MLQRITQRLIWSVFVLLGISAITFFLTQVIPGDPARFAVGLDASQEQVESYRELLGLDRPVTEQYIRYLGRLIQGDMGTSVVTRRPVLDDIRRFLPATLELVFYTMTLSIILSILLGVMSANNVDGITDQIIRVVTSFGMAVPVFWFGLILQLIFYGKLSLLPAGGRTDVLLENGTGFLTIDYLANWNFDGLLSSWEHLILPVIALTAPRIAVLSRMMRATLLDVLSEDYIRTAHAKGLANRTVLYRHALKNALIPVVTLAGLQFGWLLGGTVIVETIFRWPGLGQYAVYGILNLDYPAIVGTALVLTFCFVFINLLMDIIYTWLNPQIRF